MKKILTLSVNDSKVINSENIFDNIKKINIDDSKENFIVMTFNIKRELINAYVVTVGLVDCSLIHPRECFRSAIKDNASFIIIAHNHPSGCLKPSSNDIDITNKLIQAGKIIDIEITDSIIFNKTEYHSILYECVFT